MHALLGFTDCHADQSIHVIPPQPPVAPTPPAQSGEGVSGEMAFTLAEIIDHADHHWNAACTTDEDTFRERVLLAMGDILDALSVLAGVKHAKGGVQTQIYAASGLAAKEGILRAIRQTNGGAS